ncbi:protein FAR-RED IMPAIRED RESPONSE 1-like [Trifolium pratense]|uniref:protein FAR-RED IMPAIRED RESPONSE 1-like n=1 Tax=Trifolium pratense TaxID=57577 RepID=UPI001E69596C|nr:protein FAR-RED IMPAIRED RESPONSE 1-like [Trifolium pratense]
MPFAAFVGVNHHGQSTLLGCRLVSGEDTESFAWLFKSWLRCMVGKAPVCIITDQCKAMQNAIELVFPTTHHRWCLWHIMKKIPEKLGRCTEYNKIKAAMEEAVYDAYTTKDFEEKWCSFIEKFELQKNNWLSGLYNERHRWVPTLLRKTFWAEVATESEVATKSLHETLDDFNSNLPTMDDTTKNGKESFNDDSNTNTGTKIHSPLHVNRKGRPPKNRLISVSETVSKKVRKKSRKSDDGETNTITKMELFFSIVFGPLADAISVLELECNIGKMCSQTENSIRVESSIEVVTGESFMDSNTVVQSNMSFTELLATCHTRTKGSTEGRANV